MTCDRDMENTRQDSDSVFLVFMQDSIMVVLCGNMVE